MTPHPNDKPTRLCDCHGCTTPARFRVGFIAPFKRVILMPDSITKEFQMWLALGVCGSHREQIKTVDQLLDESQRNMLDAKCAAEARPALDWRNAFVMFVEIVDGKPDPTKVTRADGLPFTRRLVQQQPPQIIRG